MKLRGVGSESSFDSTELIGALRNNPEALERLALSFASKEHMFTSAMNVAKVYGGLRRGEELRTHELVSSLTCLPVTTEIARRAGELKAEWALKGRTFTLPDMIVAETALEHGLTIVTANRKDFAIEGLTFWL